MTASHSKQTMKPVTAAKKLGIHLPATPESFREAAAVSRSDLARLIAAPPQWLTDLRATGPHPREVVASRLGVSIAALARGGVAVALTTEQIEELRQDPPLWLRTERIAFEQARLEEERLAAKAVKAAKSATDG